MEAVDSLFYCFSYPQSKEEVQQLTLQDLHRHTKLASPLLPDTSLTSFRLVSVKVARM